MSVKTYNIVIQTSDQPQAGTGCEVWVRFTGRKARTEWFQFADHREADFPAKFRPGEITRASIRLPDLGRVVACSIVLRGPHEDQWHPRSVELLCDNQSYYWSISGPIHLDKPVFFQDPDVRATDTRIQEPATQLDQVIAQAESLMANFQADWSSDNSGAVSPRQAVLQIVDVFRDANLLLDRPRNSPP